MQLGESRQQESWGYHLASWVNINQLMWFQHFHSCALFKMQLWIAVGIISTCQALGIARLHDESLESAAGLRIARKILPKKYSVKSRIRRCDVSEQGRSGRYVVAWQTRHVGAI